MLLVVWALSAVQAFAQTSVTNTVSITPPAGVVNTNPSTSCSGGVCSVRDIDGVSPNANLGVTKTPSSVSVGTVGSTFSYVITFANTGPSSASSVTMTDNLTAAGLTLVSAQASSGTLQTTTGAVTLTLGTLASGGSGTLTLTVSVSAGAGSITNAVGITSTTPDSNTSNNTATSTISRVVSADLSVTKTPSSVSVGTVGSTFSYVITFANTGPSSASSVTMTDNLTAAGLTLVSAQASSGTLQTTTGAVTLTLGTLASGGSGTLTLTVSVSAGAGSITNAVGITSTTPDSNTSNNTATSTISRVVSADLSVTKTPSSVSVGTVGSTFSYVITFANTGPSSASSVTMTDNLTAAGLTLVSAQASSGTLQTTTGAVTLTLGTLASGGSGTLTLTVSVSAGAGSITNAVGITSTTPDSNTSNNTATSTISRVVSADLSVTKTPSSVSVGTVGSTFSYVITFANTGPSSASSVTMTDNLTAAGLTLVSAQASSGTLQTTTGAVTLTLGTLASGGSGTLTLTVSVSAGAGSITNAVGITSTTPDSNTSNNTATSTISRVVSADLSVTKTPSSVSVGTVGSTFSYVITFANTGPSSASSVTMTDNLTAAGLTLVSAQASSGTLQTTTGAVTLTLGTLASGGSGTLTLTVSVSAGAGSITNAVGITSTTPDSNTSNNTATSTISRVVSADLSVTKTPSSVSVGTVGSTFSYVITFANTGPSSASSVTMTDNLTAAGLTLVSAQASSGTLQTTTGAVTLTLGTLASGGSGTLTLTVSVSAGAGSITNAVGITSTTPDSNTSNNTATSTISRVVSADLSVTKTPSSVSVGTVGSTFSYVITFANTGPSSASSVTMTDNLTAAGLTLVSAQASSGTLQTTTGAVTLTLGTLASGGSGTLTLTVSVSAGAGSITNAVGITSTTPDSNTSNNTATSTISRVVSADLSVTKTPSSVSVGTVGSTFSYVITFANTGPSSASSVTMTDNLTAAGLTLVSAQASSGTLQTTTGAVTLTLGTLASGGSGTLTLTVSVSAGAGSITNAVGITSTTPDSNTSNNTATSTISRVVSADLSVTKTPSSVSVGTVGSTFSYVITFANTGPSSASSVTMTDNLTAAGLTLVSAQASSGTLQTTTGAVTLTLGTLASGGSGTLTLTVSVSAGAGSITNAVGITSTTPDSNTSNNTATSTISRVVSADLSVTKTPSSVSVGTVGSTFSYVITFANTGPSSASSVTMTDNLTAAGLTLVSAQASSGTLQTTTGAVTLTLGTLASGGSGTLTLTVSVSAGAGSITNAVGITSTTPDSNTSNNTATSTISRVVSADLSVTKTPSSVSVGTVGSTFSYVITFANTGPSSASSVTMTDNLTAAGLTLVSAQASSGTLQTTTGAVTLTLGTLASGGSGTLTLTVSVSAGAGSITNAVGITSTTPDSNTSNNTATSTISRVVSADLSVTKTPSSVSVGTVGSTFSYVITFANTGPSSASSVTMTDNLTAAGLTLVSAQASSGTLQTTTGAVTLTLGTLASGGSGTLTLTVSVSAGAGSITNAVGITSTTPDSNTSNNTATSTISRVVSADLSVTKTPSSVSVGTVGSTFSYVITFANTGPSSASSVTMTDNLTAAGLTLVSAQASSGTLQTTTGAVTLTLGTLASGGSGTLTLTVSVSAGAGSITNAVGITSTTPDSNTSNNTATSTISRVVSADLSVTKTPSSVSVGTVGSTFSYVITFANTGPSSASSVTMTDNLTAAGLTLVSAQASSGTLQTTTGAVTLTLGTLASGGSGTLTLTVSVSAGAGSITNAVGITSTTPDSNTSNNTATSTISRVVSADLSVTKTPSSVSVGTVGSTFSYVITFANTGPSSASSVTMTDNLTAAGLTLVSAQASSGTLQTTTGAVTLTLGTLASGGSGTLTLTVSVSAGAGSITNAVGITSTTPDSNTSNNTATSTISRVVSADLSVTKTPSSVSVGTVGSTFSYVITFANTGPSSASSVTMTDNLTAAGLTLVSAQASSGTLQTTTGAVTLTLGTLASGGSGTLTLTVSVSAGAGSITNAVGITSTTPDSNTSNNTATSTISRVVSADLSVTKTPSSVSVGTVGSTFSYVITFANTGPSSASSVTMTDNLTAAGLTLVSAQASSGTLQTTTGAVTLTLGTLASGGSGTLTLTVSVSAGAGSITNAVGITSTTPDSNTSNNTATSTISRVVSADLSVTKTPSSVSVGTVGSTFSYVITFANTGPSSASSVTMTDNLTAAGLTLVSAQASSGTLQTTTGAVTLTLGTLASGGSGTLTLTVSVSAGAGSITNAVGITSTTPDSNTSNNTATSTISRVVSADLSVTKTPPAPT
jgi:uncharacterized repeat protein (TIGR01451 family)